MAENSKNNSSRTNTEDFGRIISYEPNSNSPCEDSDDVLSPDSIYYSLSTSLIETQDQPESSSRHSIKKRSRARCVVQGTWKVSFGLFQHHQRGRNYILEMHKVEAGERDMYHIFVQIFVQNNEQKLDIGVKKLPLQQDVVPLPDVIESIQIQPRYRLSLQERLEGWTLQKKKRNSSNTSDKYYIHDKVPQNFRSLKEVATFILYSCRRNDLALAQVGDGTRSDTRNVHIVNEIEKKIEGIQSELGNGEQNKMDDEELEIFACALNNPIIDL